MHMQYQSTAMICYFMKLSKVRILPKAVDQAKKATLKRALLQIGNDCKHGELRHFKMIKHQTILPKVVWEMSRQPPLGHTRKLGFSIRRDKKSINSRLERKILIILPREHSPYKWKIYKNLIKNVI
jgi:hypothetical protein